MNARKRLMAASLGLAMVVVPVTAAGFAQAAESDGTGAPIPESSEVPDSTEGTPETPGESTQSPLQLGSAVGSLVGENEFQVMDALNGDNRPDGANGVESEIPPLDPRYVEGPLGGLAKNGPQG